VLWRKPKLPEQVIRVKVDGAPAGDVNSVDYWMAMAGAFANAPGLEQSLTEDFKDTMDGLEKLPADAHGERIRLAQKACDLWRFLNIPRAAVAQADRLIGQQRAERTESPKAPPGLKAEM
jgi:hypothetical protein